MIEGSDLAKSTVAVVLAGGKGTRLGALTRRICKPAIPFGGAYRSIDFSLSNCVNSGVARVGVATQHRPQALLRHIDRVWRNAITDQEQRITPWPASQRAPRQGYVGTADAVFRNLETIRGLRSRFVLVLAGDHVYKMDYRPLLAYHCEHEADITVGCVDVPIHEARHFGIMSVDDDGRVCRFVEKPKTLHELSPVVNGRVSASMGIYVFSASFLASVLERDACSNDSRHDFGCDILPSLIGQARVFAYPFRGPDQAPGYWRDIGTPSAYWRAHLDLLDPSTSLHLDDPSWPLRTDPAAGPVSWHAVRNSAGTAEFSLVAGRCAIRGATVHRSVLFAGVKVSAGTEISESVVLPGAVIGRHCRLRGVIVDSGCRIPDGTEIDRSMRGHAVAAETTIVTPEGLPASFTQPVAAVIREGAVA